MTEDSERDGMGLGGVLCGVLALGIKEKEEDELWAPSLNFLFFSVEKKKNWLFFLSEERTCWRL